MVTCRPSYYRVHLHRTPSTPFCFPCFVFPCCRAAVCLREIDQRRQRNGTKVHSVSWRQSAETAANACSSKVIAGQFYGLDCERAALSRSIWVMSRSQKAAAGTVHGPIAAGKWTASATKRKSDWRTTRRRNRGGIPSRIVCDRLYGPDRAVCWRHRRRMIRYRGVCAKVCDG